VSLITVDQMAQFAPHCDAEAMAAALDAAATEFDIATPARLAHFLAQCHVESAGFTRLVENLNYSADRLTVVWPRRFPTLAEATPYAHNPAALAEKVYGGRMGNNEAGDGARYIGRGLLMNTGRDGYARTGLLTGEDLLAHPELLETPPVAARAAAAFWRDHDLNALADQADVVGITRVINGGLNGIADRQTQVQRARAIWS